MSKDFEQNLGKEAPDLKDGQGLLWRSQGAKKSVDRYFDG